MSQPVSATLVEPLTVMAPEAVVDSARTQACPPEVTSATARPRIVTAVREKTDDMSRGCNSVTMTSALLVEPALLPLIGGTLTATVPTEAERPDFAATCCAAAAICVRLSPARSRVAAAWAATSAACCSLRWLRYQ